MTDEWWWWLDSVVSLPPALLHGGGGGRRTWVADGLVAVVSFTRLVNVEAGLGSSTPLLVGTISSTLASLLERQLPYGKGPADGLASGG